jgi:hypothetical protein
MTGTYTTALAAAVLVLTILQARQPPPDATGVPRTRLGATRMRSGRACRM